MAISGEYALEAQNVEGYQYLSNSGAPVVQATTGHYVLYFQADGPRFIDDAGVISQLGGLTSVDLDMPGELNVANVPLTSNGTIVVTWVSQSANAVFAAPSGGAGTPTFRALVAADIPNLPASIITSGTFANARINWESPGTLGSITPNTVDSTTFTAASGNVTISSTGITTFNVNNADVDFAIHGDTTNNVFYVDASTNRIGLGTVSPTAFLCIDGKADEIQLTVEANGTQTNVLSEWRNSSSVAILQIDKDGHIGIPTAGANNWLRINPSVSDPASTTQFLTVVPAITLTALNNTIIRGLVTQPSLNHATFNYTNTFTAALVSPSVSGTSGTVTRIVGLDILLDFATAGTVSNVNPVRIRTVTSTGGTLTSVIALQIQDQTVGATNKAIETNAGLIVFNEGGHAESDVRMEGDTLQNLFFLDTSADTVHINSATTADSAIFYVNGKISTSGEMEINGALNHDGTTVGFRGVAPVVISAAYTPTNISTDRSYDANATSVDELADVLGTLIADLQLQGLIG